MRSVRTGVVGVVLALTAGVLAQGDAARVLVGRWEGQRATEGRTDNIAFVFVATRQGVTGEAFLNKEKFDTVTDIKVAADKVTFDVGNMAFTGRIKGKTIELTAHFENRDLWMLTVSRKDTP